MGKGYPLPSRLGGLEERRELPERGPHIAHRLTMKHRRVDFSIKQMPGGQSRSDRSKDEKPLNLADTQLFIVNNLSEVKTSSRKNSVRAKSLIGAAPW